MENKNKRVIDLYYDEFENSLTHIIEKRLNSAIKDLHKGEELVSRNEAKERLGIAYSTLADYTKKGILPSYRIGNRVYYKWSEVVGSAIKVHP